MKTPYLKFNKEKLIANYELFEKTCEKHFKNKFQICFSMKTNTNPLTIKTLSKTGAGFEIASLREMKLTSHKAFRVMNGPAKTTEELKQAIKEDVLIFIDSFSEMNKIIELQKKHSNIKEHIFGIRLGDDKNKFGFTKNQLKEVMKFAKENELQIKAIQLHQGTLNKFSEFEKNLKDQYKIIKPYLKQMEFLDFGGGFPDNFQLKNLQLTINDYLSEIKQTFKEFKGIFIFEPGRNLVADAYTLITKVIVIKEKSEPIAVLDAGINILSKITLAQFKFNKLKPTNLKTEISTIKTNLVDKEKAKTYTLAGPLLFNNDLIGKWHGKLQEGDCFEVENVGAYCENLSWEIIYNRPEVK
jgi:diaminopimelate decarboxylase